MKSQLSRILALSVFAVLPQLQADEPILYARQGNSQFEANEPLLAANNAANNTSRSAAAPVQRQNAPAATSRQDAGIIARTTVHQVLLDQSYIVLKTDDATSHYRYHKGTQFIDERGRVLSPDALKSGTNATLYYTRSDDEATLSKVIVNTEPRPLHGQLQARVDDE